MLLPEYNHLVQVLYKEKIETPSNWHHGYLQLGECHLRRFYDTKNLSWLPHTYSVSWNRVGTGTIGQLNVHQELEAKSHLEDEVKEALQVSIEARPNVLAKAKTHKNLLEFFNGALGEEKLLRLCAEAEIPDKPLRFKKSHSSFFLGKDRRLSTLVHTCVVSAEGPLHELTVSESLAKFEARLKQVEEYAKQQAQDYLQVEKNFWEAWHKQVEVSKKKYEKQCKQEAADVA